MTYRRLLVRVLAAAMAVSGAAQRAAAQEPGPRIEHGAITSFDGTPIAYTLFVPPAASPAAPVPVILIGNAPNDQGRLRSATGLVGTLLGEGYSVLTWDTRGSGDSGGEANFNAVDVEVRDVRALLDFAGARPEVQKDGPGDPRAGMAGMTYAGAIQLMTASADPRVDAIAPQQTWNDFARSFRPGGVLKSTWPLLGYGTSVGFSAATGLDSPHGPQAGAVDPHLHQAVAEAAVFNDWSPATVAWFAARSPGNFISGAPGVSGVRIPTLVIQGVTEPLFTMNEGVATYLQVRGNGAPAKLVVACTAVPLRPAGSACTPATDQAERLAGTVLAWFDQYLKEPIGDTSTGPPIEFQVQDGTFAAAHALAPGSPAGSGTATLVSAVAPTSGALTSPQPSPTGARIPLSAPAGAVLFGVPKVDVVVTGTGSEAFLFFKLLDVDATGKATVVDDQVTARKVTGLSAQPQRISVDLGGVAWRLAPGHTLFLEVSTSSNDHTASRASSVADVDVAVELPLCPGGPDSSC